MNLKFSLSKIIQALTYGIGALIVLHLLEHFCVFTLGHDYMMGLRGEFDLDGENNIPTLFSFGLFMFAVVLLLVIALDHGKKRSAFVRHWMGLAVVFGFLALDEVCSIHEGWVEPLRTTLKTSGFFYYIWQLPYVVFLGLAGIVYLSFFKVLSKQTRGWMIAAASLYLTGVGLMEFLGGWYTSVLGKQGDIIYMFLVAVEETLEMCGLAVFIYALLRYIQKEIGPINIELEN